jgi:nickel-dependent lactate racemase
MQDIEMAVGRARWSFRVPDDRLITAVRRSPPGLAVTDPRAAVRAALDHPFGLDFALRRALTPEDRIALVVDEQLPRLGELIAGTLEYLAAAGIGPEAVTVLTPEHGDQRWIDELPDEFADVRAEVHQPGDRKLLSYLATTKRGRRVYLNRTLVDADQIIVLSGRRYDAQLGYSGLEGSIYPGLSDAETRQALGGVFSLEGPGSAQAGARAEAAEIAGQLGSTIFIQVIESAGDEIAAVLAGLAGSGVEGIRLQDERWRLSVPAPADLVIASVGGAPEAQDFTPLARAAAAAARVVSADGAVVVLSDAEPALGKALEMLQGAGDPDEALRRLKGKKTADLEAAHLWAGAAGRARLYLASGLRPDAVEEMFATPILAPGEVQRLIDQGGTVLLLPDAEKSLVVVE